MTDDRLADLAGKYRELLLARGNTTKHANDTFKRINALLTIGQIHHFHQLTQTSVLLAAGQLKTAGKSLATLNHHLRAIKSFARWIYTEGLADKHPLAGLRLYNERLDVRHPRRALSRVEQAILLAATIAGDTRAGMTPAMRAMFYELAMATGLRSNEIRQLRCSDLEHCQGRWWLRVRPETAKSRKEALLPLSAEFGARIAAFGRRRGLRHRLFDLPTPSHIVRMLRHDLRRAGIPYRTDAGYADLHAMRHSFVTELTDVCGDMKTILALSRLSSTALVYGRYAHGSSAALVDAVDRLQSLGSRSSSDQSFGQG